MTTLALIDLASLFVPAWKAVPPTEPADAPHNITVARVRSIAAEHVVGGLYFPEELGHDAPADDEAA